jgi:hypothetical protein
MLWPDRNVWILLSEFDQNKLATGFQGSGNVAENDLRCESSW